MAALGSAADSAPQEDDGGLSIQQAARTVNVPAPTIRSWERRYGVPAANRSSGGHRRYSRDQLDRLRWMRDLVAQGRRPIEAAALVRAGHGNSSDPLVAAFLQAASDMDPDRIAKTLEVARQSMGLERAVDDVLIPAMREVGESWRVGRLDISHEHLATNATRAWLSTLAAPGPLRPERPIVLCSGPQDQHSLSLEAIGALLRRRRWDCRLLGARTPVESLSLAIEETNAVAVILVCYLTAGRTAAVEALRSAERRRAHLFYAGGVFASRQARQGVPGRYLGTNLAAAADLVTDTITSTKADSSPA
jgi:MerR family transcriptional regulator, light-induced transcriptional regulator